MSNFRKLTAGLLAIGICLSFAGCGNSDSSSSGTAAADKETSSFSAEDLYDQSKADEEMEKLTKYEEEYSKLNFPWINNVLSSVTFNDEDYTPYDLLTDSFNKISYERGFKKGNKSFDETFITDAKNEERLTGEMYYIPKPDVDDNGNDIEAVQSSFYIIKGKAIGEDDYEIKGILIDADCINPINFSNIEVGTTTKEQVHEMYGEGWAVNTGEYYRNEQFILFVDYESGETCSKICLFKTDAEPVLPDESVLDTDDTSSEKVSDEDTPAQEASGDSYSGEFPTVITDDSNVEVIVK